MPLVSLMLGGCAATVDNDDFDWGRELDKDRWYTGGARFELAVDPDAPASQSSVFERLIRDVARCLPGDEPEGLTSITGVLGIEAYTPEDTEALEVQSNDRPFAGWLYVGVARYETWLDADSSRRHDERATVELDVGVVGPASHVEDVQKWLHETFSGDDAQGWDNQLDNELGLVLRGARDWRLDYAEWGAPGGLAYDLGSRVEGALGNVDTHVGVGGTTRLGLNLSRDFGFESGAARPAADDDGRDTTSSLFLFADLEGRFVIHNLLLDGNTFEDSHSVHKERWVGEGALGIGWERGPWRIAYSRHVLTEEFTDQGENQVYGSITLAWTPQR